MLLMVLPRQAILRTTTPFGHDTINNIDNQQHRQSTTSTSMLLMVLPRQAIIRTTTPFGRQPPLDDNPLWTTTTLDDILSDDIPFWTTTPFGRQPPWDDILSDDILSDDNPLGRQPRWTTTSLDDNLRGSATRGYMSRPVFSWMLCCESSHCEAED
jgi:hypothetical protein